MSYKDLQTRTISRFGIDRILHLAYGEWFSAFFYEWYWILLAGGVITTIVRLIIITLTLINSKIVY